MPAKTYGVSELCADIKYILQENFLTEVQVRGELGELSAASSGHWYFSLKDEESQLGCVMFRTASGRMGEPPPLGTILTLSGEISFYQGRGKLQLVVRKMIIGEQGDMRKKIDILKEKLHQEGLFAEERKKEMPSFIRRLGLITSESGAAMHDIKKVLARRMPSMRIFLFPVVVQGKEAARQITAALSQANHYPGLDVVLITRGGGSPEDLWCFNDENLVRAVVASFLPVMTAIGHEIDSTLADFAADKSASTPSVAAELLSIDSSQCIEQMDEQAERMEHILAAEIHDWMQECDELYKRVEKTNPCSIFEARLTNSSLRLNEKTQYYLLQLRLSLAWWQERLSELAPHKQQRQHAVELREISLNLFHGMKSFLRTYEQNLGKSEESFSLSWQNLLARKKRQLSRWEELIRSLSPQAVLERGYAVVTDEEGRLVRDENHVKIKDVLSIRLATARLDTEVRRIHKKGEDPNGRAE